MPVLKPLGLMKFVETQKSCASKLVVEMMRAAHSDCARAMAASATSRAVIWSRVTATEARSRRLTARNATAISTTTESMIKVVTSATPRWD